MKNYMIGVPSRERSHKITEGHFYKNFSEAETINYFVREEEVHIYESEGLKVVPVNNNFHIAQKRKLIFQVAYAKGFEYVFIADDDIKIDVRREDIKTRFRPMEKIDVPAFINLHLKVCGEKYPLVHPILRMHADKKKYMYEKNVPAIRFVCYHIPTFIREGIQIDGLSTPFMSDRYAQLSILSKGYSSIALAKYCVDDSGTNAKGGCSIYRTPKLQSEAAKRLQQCFPNNVSLKVKQDGKWNEPRLDCTIQWKKFLKKDELPYIPKEEI